MSRDADTTQLYSKIKETLVSIETLNDLIKGVENNESSFRSNPISSNADKLLRGVETMETNYEISLTNINQLIVLIDNMIKKSTPKDDSTITSLPSPESVNDMVKNFFMDKIKTRSPVPPFAGCYSYRQKTPKPYSFVCGKYNDFFPLMLTISFDPKTDMLTVIDSTDVDSNGVKTIELKSLNDWTPLPSVIPDKPIGRWEYSKNSTVLSLYKQSEAGDSWTNRFFKATVIKRPCDKAHDQEERGYILDFGDGIQQNVPEQFVVNYSESWSSVGEKALLKNYLNSL